MIVVYVLYTAATILMFVGILRALWRTRGTAADRRQPAVHHDPGAKPTKPSESAEPAHDETRDLLVLLGLEQHDIRSNIQILTRQIADLQIKVGKISDSDGLTHGILEHIAGSSYYGKFSSDPQRLSIETLYNDEDVQRTPRAFV